MVLLLSKVRSTSDTCEFPQVSSERWITWVLVIGLPSSTDATAFRTICLDHVVSSVACKERRMQRWLRHSRSFLVCSCVPKRFVFYRLNSFCLWDCARAGPAEFRHHFKAFLFQNSALFTNKSTKENLLTETENSKFEIQNTNPDRMQQQQSGMFSSVFILNVLFDLSDDLSTFRARPVCELYNILETNHIAGPLQRSYVYFEKFVSLTFSPFCCCVIWL